MQGFVTYETGSRVLTASGRFGTVYGSARRAASDIRTAASETVRDLSPYTVRVDGLSGFSVYRGHELAAITDCDECQGAGRVLSLAPDNVSRCDRCGGRGEIVA